MAKPETLSTRLLAQADDLRRLAHLCCLHNPQLANALVLQAARTGLASVAAQSLEQELAATQAQLAGSRAARRQSEATVRHLTAELLAEQDLARATELPLVNPAHQAIIDRIKADLLRPIG